ncbi:MAG: MaoC/PaaZ C-terminal domain-containing protein, partial [Streptosporangiaceae bacterium]
GFARPILHGLCTYGVTGRALLYALCGSNPARFAAMSGRFTRPVMPGDALTVSMWITENGSGNGNGRALFQTATQDGTIVIDRGVARFRPA